jgi:hypothetical protein
MQAEQVGNLVIIGNGNLDQARDFAQTHGKNLRSLVDTKKLTYQVLGFNWGVFRTMGAASVLRGIQTTARGFRQGRTQGDGLQLGGTLVLAKGGRPVYFQRSRYAGDHPPIEQVLAALTAVAAGAGAAS